MGPLQYTPIYTMYIPSKVIIFRQKKNVHYHYHYYYYDLIIYFLFFLPLYPLYSRFNIASSLLCLLKDKGLELKELCLVFIVCLESTLLLLLLLLVDGTRIA